MDHVLELAPSGRATCRTCGNKIAKGEVRFGEASAYGFLLTLAIVFLTMLTFGIRKWRERA